MTKTESFIKILTDRFETLNQTDLIPLISENLICPNSIALPKAIRTEIIDIVKAIYTLRSSPNYQNFYHDQIKNLNFNDPKNKSVFMSYDFHLSTNNSPKLIEINTNAAFLILGYYLYQLFQLPTGFNFKIEDLKENFERELRFQGKKIENITIGIMDEHPKEQKLYAEFLLADQLFKKFGWNSKIINTTDYKSNTFDIIYNRFTDFYFDQPVSIQMKKDFNTLTTCFSPNPFEYFMLADKQRLVDWNTAEFWDFLKLDDRLKTLILRALPKTSIFDPNQKEQIWLNRKNLFFKPKNSFGSKQSYKGASISKKIFDTVSNESFIVQELIPAPEIDLPTPNGDQKYKFDLRCYAYEGDVQMVVARVFQGQVTNLKTEWGGFAPINWI